MKTLKFIGIFLSLFGSLSLVSCKDDPDYSTTMSEYDMKGRWLASFSDANNWVTYEFNTSSRINVEEVKNGNLSKGDGYYSIEENNKILSNYTTDRGETKYIDWNITDYNYFEIKYKLYNDNDFAGEYALYKIFSTIELGIGETTTPDYKKLCSVSKTSDFSSLNQAIVEVDENTGELRGKTIGTSFVVLNTPAGHAVIQVNVQSSVKPFAELMLGTWIYDDTKTKEWQKTKFVANDYVYVEWTSPFNTNKTETGDGYYSISGDNNLSFTITTPYGLQINQDWETVNINDIEWTYKAYSDGASVGEYTGHRLLDTLEIDVNQSLTPDYETLLPNCNITGYSVHNSKIATVDDKTGKITALSGGRTYVDVITAMGTAVVEVNVSNTVIPVAFQDCLGKDKSAVYELIGDNPYYEDDSFIMYNKYSTDIDMVSVVFDPWTNLVKGVSINFKSSVDTAAVTKTLDNTFIPFESQSTSTFKAYMNTDNRATATVGVTWDIEKLTLTYVNLDVDLFVNYSVLIGMTHQQVLKKMNMEPYKDDEESQVFFFYDNKGVQIVSAYYTDFSKVYNTVVSVVTSLDPKAFTEDQVLTYLKRKYIYYPEYSSDGDYMFASQQQDLVIYYMPESNMVMYMLVNSPSNMPAMKARLKAAKKKIVNKK